MKFQALTVLISIMAFHQLNARNKLDSMPARNRKNLIEYNYNAINLHDKQSYMYMPPSWYLSYSRDIYKGYFVRLEYFDYSIANLINDQKEYYELKRGDVSYTWFNVVRLNLGKTIEYNRFFIKPSLSFNKRWGFGEMYWWDLNWTESKSNRNEMNSYGIGDGLGIGYNVSKRFIISVENNFHYNFEKYKFLPGGGISKEDSDAFNFKPNRKFSTFQIKLGVKF